MDFYTYLDTSVLYIFRIFVWPCWIGIVYLLHAMYLCIIGKIYWEIITIVGVIDILTMKQWMKLHACKE